MSATETQIRKHVDTFVKELDALVRQSALEALKDALGSTGSPTSAPRRGPGRPRKAGGKRPGRPRKDVSGLEGSIVAHVQGKDGSMVSDIATGIGASLADTKKAVKQLMETGALRTTGQRRGTRYHLGSGAPSQDKGPKGRGKARKASRGGRRAKKVALGGQGRARAL